MYLDSVGHAKVDGGAYYDSITDGHELWLLTFYGSAKI